MPNLTNILNEHVRRLARREIRRNIKATRKLTAQYRRDIAALKREIASLTRAVSFLEKQEKRRTGAAAHRAGALATSAAAGGETGGKSLRFRAEGMKTHRAKLGLSAADYGKLVGVSGLTIYHWESRKAKPRRSQLPKLASIRGLGKREALKRLELLGHAA
jgi:DNA-binding transcriptional regulator YiaG